MPPHRTLNLTKITESWGMVDNGLHVSYFYKGELVGSLIVFTYVGR